LSYRVSISTEAESISVSDVDVHSIDIQDLTTGESAQVIIPMENPNSVEVTDDMAFPTSITNPSFGALTGNPFTVRGENVGLQITDPQFGLHISGSLFAPVISGSKMEIHGASATDLFIVKAYGSEDSKFVINLHGVTILGKFDLPPPFADGGMFYSSSGDFYLGS